MIDTVALSVSVSLCFVLIFEIFRLCPFHSTKYPSTHTHMRHSIHMQQRNSCQKLCRAYFDVISYMNNENTGAFQYNFTIALNWGRTAENSLEIHFGLVLIKWTRITRMCIEPFCRRSVVSVCWDQIKRWLYCNRCKPNVSCFILSDCWVSIEFSWWLKLFADGDGDGQAAVDDAALRTLVNEINAKMASREIEQRLNFVQYEWDNPIGEFLVLCNTFAAPG